MVKRERQDKVENKVKRRSSAAHNIDYAADKVRAVRKAMGKKVREPNNDLGTEHNAEKARKDSINFSMFSWVTPDGYVTS